MLGFILAVLLLMITFQVLMKVSVWQRSRLYATYRDLDSFPQDHPANKKHRAWGFIGWIAWKGRLPLLLLLLGGIFLKLM